MATIIRGNTRTLAGLAIVCVLAAASVGAHPHGGSNTGLNPQPLPPRFGHGASIVQVALNPQPEPPGRRGVPRFLPPGPCRRSAVVA